MLLERIEKSLIKIQENLNKDEFIYDFLEAYEQPKSSIKRLKDGDYNLSKKPNEVIWKKKLYFYNVLDGEDIHEVIDTISKSELIEKNKIRYIIVTDFKEFLSIDKKNNTSLDINFSELSKNNSFFLPLLGIEKFELTEEIEADRKAAINIGKLYEQIILDNKIFKNKLTAKDLNLFFSRLLFLYYADDSNIFEKNIFLKTLKEATNEDGNDLDKFFILLFEILDSKDRKNCISYLIKFPYVNGYLFKTKIQLPKFTNKTRDIIIKNASLEWKNINPDILGSMLQAVINTEERDDDGMHYTSVSNILKVIAPLFLNKLKEDIKTASRDEKRLKKILLFIYNLKVFDPACGSGNFLIITYKQLCLLEIKIFEYLREINPDYLRMATSGISLNQFYGIEKSHFASETTKLSLWLAEHQMNLKFCELFGKIKPSLPIENLSNIVCGNSMDIDWNTFCKFEEKTSYIYIIGNPPFKGSRKQNFNQKQDIQKILKNLKGYKRLDYVSLWFFKAKKYIDTNKNSSCSFVSTNSICQGEHVSLLWPELLKSLEIKFAVKDFKWSNNAKNNAGVYCVILGLGRHSSEKKFLIDGLELIKTNYISPYLTTDNFVNIVSKQKPFSNIFPEMVYGNMSLDGGFLKLNVNEYEQILKENYKSAKFLRPLTGADEFIKSHKRWCIWINDEDLDEALKIKAIKERIEYVKRFRKAGGEVAKTLVTKSHQFRYRHQANKYFILVPCTSTSSRDYLPIGYFDKNYISLHSAQVIYDPPLFIFSILSSNTHMIWSKIVGGKHGIGVRYSSSLCYNTFPISIISKDQINKLEEITYKILEVRESYSQLPIFEIYSDEMPMALKKIHKQNDDIVDEIIFGQKDLNEDTKVSLLLEKYQNCIMNESRELF